MKTVATRTATKMVMINIGYDSKVLVPAAKAGALIALLSECQFVSSEWLGDFDILSREDYDLTREEIRQQQEAIKAAAEAELNTPIAI